MHTDTPIASIDRPASTEPLHNWRTQPLVLIGLMGAGKSTVGARLAKKIGWRFVDSDEEIETAAGCSIADIFELYGEPIFRDLELKVINRLLRETGIVLATGGGAWMQPAVREAIQRQGQSIWLRAELEVLIDRVSKRNHRPLLENGDKTLIMQRLMAERYPHYALADRIVDSGQDSHDRVVEKILALLDGVAL